MIQAKGTNGESIIFDGNFVIKMRHDGKQEITRNTIDTYRESQVKAKKLKKGHEQEYEALIACGAFFSLTVTEEQKPALDELIAALDATKA
ncbi:MAG: hypothetical protein U0W40_05175 [Acidimicrobiia bacterium]